jgi:hypothetical protein
MVPIHVFIKTMSSWRLENPSGCLLFFYFSGDGSIHEGTSWSLMAMADMYMYFYVHDYIEVIKNFECMSCSEY